MTNHFLTHAKDLAFGTLAKAVQEATSNSTGFSVQAHK
jgi:hypothetical protein